MANVNKTSFAVSVTPKIQMDAADGVNVAMDVINENVRKTLGGNGEIVGNNAIISDYNNNGSGGSNWSNGGHSPVSSNGSLIAFDTNTDLIFIKHMGVLFGTTTASADADTLKIAIDGSETSGVSGDAVVIATLKNGEAFVAPRPGIAGGYILVTGNASNHVAVESLVVGT
jgi:hypothetical protein